MGTRTKETDTDLFEDAAECTVEVHMLEETYQDILALCEQQSWEEDEGLRIVVANGLAYLRGDTAIQRVNAGDVDVAEELQRKVQQVVDYYGMYSVMKFKAFKLLQVSQTMELNRTGMRGELSLARKTIQNLRQEIEELKTENADLRQQLQATDPVVQTSGKAQPAPAEPTPGKPEPASPDANAAHGNTPWDRLRQWIAGT